MDKFIGDNQFLVDHGQYLFGSIVFVGFVALLLALVRRTWATWIAAILTVAAIAARAFLVWQGYIFEPSRVRLIDVLLASVIVAIVGLGVAFWEGSTPSERLGLTAAVLALPVASFAALQVVVPTNPSNASVGACEGAPIAGSGFVAKTGDNGLNARSGPGTTYEPTRRFGAGCLIGADAYCVGEPVKDMFVPSLFDVRWLRVRHTKDYVAAGAVFAVRSEGGLGNEPEADCPGERPEPELTGEVSARKRGADTVRIRARPVATELVGFGVQYLDESEQLINLDDLGVSPQLGITPKLRRSNGVVRADLTLSANRAAVSSAAYVDVAVVPCLAPIVPSHAEGKRLRIDLKTGSVKRLDWPWSYRDRPVQAACRLDPTKSNDEFAKAATR